MQIGDVARRAGVTVRTLHHWEGVGLIAPSGRAANGYRAFGEADLSRVRSIVAWRSLGLPLEEIRVLLAGGATTEQLQRQHDALVTEAARLTAMADAVARALEARRMGIELDPAEVRDVFGDDDPSRHAAAAEEQWGTTDSWRESQRRTSSYSKDDWLRMRAEQEDLEARLAAAMLAGADGRDLAREHAALISRWFYDCTPEIHQGLAELYLADERFRAHYDDRAPGLAQWLHDAIVVSYPS